MKALPLGRRGSLALLMVSLLLLAGCGGDDGVATARSQKTNILFIAIDDFGVDQMTSYGYGGAVPPKTPNLTAIAQAGLQFRSAWAMPTCTPTRATFKDVPAAGFEQCGQVMSYRKSLNPDDKVDVLPDSQKAVSDGRYKLVRLNRKTYTTITADPVGSTYTGNQNTDELYEIDMAVPNPKLDKINTAIAVGSPTITATLPPEAHQPYGTLKAEMDWRDQVAAFNNQYDAVHCPGDGNRDGAVDQQDLDLWAELSQLNMNNGVAQSSWYDLNHDGITDGVDRALIEDNLGSSCALSPV